MCDLFQSLIGIQGNSESVFADGQSHLKAFQSLIGIQGNSEFKVPGWSKSIGELLVSIPDRDSGEFRALVKGQIDILASFNP